MSLLNRLAQKAVDVMLARARVPDPASFGDPLALRIEWSPLVPGGTSFRTRVFEETAPGCLEAKRSWAYLVWSGVCLAVGVALSVLIFPTGLLFGVPFLAGGIAMLWPRPRPGFHLDQREYRSQKHTVAFAQIHALQLLEEQVSGSEDSASFMSYELNLVLKDGARVNVLDHGDVERIKHDAALIAAMVGCPIWNGVDAPKLSAAELKEMLQLKARAG